MESNIGTMNIIIIGIVLIVLYSIYAGQIELASVGLGAIAGYLARGYDDYEKMENDGGI